MKDLNIKPSLRISHIVYGRLGSDNRVKYLVDANGKGEKMAIPETVVLTRWRKRKFPGYIFSGARLSSTLWRAVGKAFGVDAKAICKLSVEEIAQITESEGREYVQAFPLTAGVSSRSAWLALRQQGSNNPKSLPV